MPIKITPGPTGPGASVIIFDGVSADGQTSANIVNHRARVQARISSIDSNLVEVVDLLQRNSLGGEILDIGSVHYDQWLDADGNTFQNAGDVVGYIDGLRLSYIATRLNLTAAPTIGSVETTVGVGNSFVLAVEGSSYGAIYWDESTFVSGVEVSRYDRRKISGTISSTGVYNFGYTLSNINGNNSGTAVVNVV